MKNLAFCSGYNVSTLEIYKRGLKMRRS